MNYLYQNVSIWQVEHGVTPRLAGRTKTGRELPDSKARFGRRGA